jgi:hypothetical protein
VIPTNPLGRPWTADGFSSSWGKLSDRAGIDDHTFHNLRGTAVVRLAIAEMSATQPLASPTAWRLCYNRKQAGRCWRLRFTRGGRQEASRGDQQVAFQPSGNGMSGQSNRLSLAAFGCEWYVEAKKSSFSAMAVRTVVERWR